MEGAGIFNHDLFDSSVWTGSMFMVGHPMVFRTGFVKVHLGGAKPVYISQMPQSHWIFVDDMYEMLLGSFFGV